MDGLRVQPRKGVVGEYRLPRKERERGDAQGEDQASERDDDRVPHLREPLSLLVPEGEVPEQHAEGRHHPG